MGNWGDVSRMAGLRCRGLDIDTVLFEFAIDRGFADPKNFRGANAIPARSHERMTDRLLFKRIQGPHFLLRRRLLRDAIEHPRG